jgi:hypothetical protein
LGVPAAGRRPVSGPHQEPALAKAGGKDERGVGYVKGNAIAGRHFISWAALEGLLVNWMREVADQHVHGTTGETPIERFQRAEAAKLRPIDGRPLLSLSKGRQLRELIRRVQSDCTIELDTNAYSVPWRLIGETVQVVVAGGRVSIRHQGAEVASHAETSERRARVLVPIHLAGVGRPKLAAPVAGEPVAASAVASVEPELLRPLAEYERLVGGGW